MTDLSTIYQSKTQKLPEVLNNGLFDVDDSIEAKIEGRLDNGIIDNLSSAISHNGIPIEGTYFIINVGGPHLPGIGKFLIEQGVDPHFFVPSPFFPSQAGPARLPLPCLRISKLAKRLVYARPYRLFTL